MSQVLIEHLCSEGSDCYFLCIPEIEIAKQVSSYFTSFFLGKGGNCNCGVFLLLLGFFVFVFVLNYILTVFLLGWRMRKVILPELAPLGLCES